MYRIEIGVWEGRRDPSAGMKQRRRPQDDDVRRILGAAEGTGTATGGVRHFHRFIILLRRAKCKTLCVYIGWPVSRSPKGWRPEGRRYKTCAYAFALVRSSTYVFTVSNAVALFEKRCGPKCVSSSLSRASHSACVAHSKATPCSLFGASVGVARKSEQLIPRRPGNIFHTS